MIHLYYLLKMVIFHSFCKRLPEDTSLRLWLGWKAIPRSSAMPGTTPSLAAAVCLTPLDVSALPAGPMRLRVLGIEPKRAAVGEALHAATL